MHSLRKSRVKGWLPAGLVLNTRIQTIAAEDEEIYVPVITTPGLKEGASTSIYIANVGQASQKKMIVLSGRICTPVIMAVLGDKAPTYYQGFTGSIFGHTQVSPYHDPVILMNHVLFDGEIIEFAGDDCPIHALTVEVNQDYQTLYHAHGEGYISLFEICLPCGLYVPHGYATSGLFGIDEEEVLHLIQWARGVDVAYVQEDAVKSLYASKDLVVKVYELAFLNKTLLGLTALSRDSDHPEFLYDWHIKLRPVGATLSDAIPGISNYAYLGINAMASSAVVDTEYDEGRYIQVLDELPIILSDLVHWNPVSNDVYRSCGVLSMPMEEVESEVALL